MKEIKYNEDGTITIDGNVYAPLIKADYPPTKTKMQEARERYPSGTKVKSMCTDKVEVISECKYCDTINDVGNVYLTYKYNYKDYSNIMVYDGYAEKWAEIVTEPLHPTIEDMRLIPQDPLDTIYKDAVADLLYVANYYNAKYPSEQRNIFLLMD